MMVSLMGLLARFKRGLKELLFGMFYLDLYRESLKYSRQLNDLMNLVLLGEFLGIPILSTNVTIKLLPYLYKDLHKWRVQQLKEREVTDEVPDTV